MGLDVNAIRFLLDARASGVSFERVATIGRQTLHIDENTLAGLLDASGIRRPRDEAARILTEAGGFCEPLLRVMGASDVCSIDASPYQQATFIHDMNDPIPSSLEARFTLVIDGGSLEHVFNFPRAIANCMEMVQVGGHFVATTPSNNFMGHGFYQFSPELYYRVFSSGNGFVTERIVVYQEVWPFVWYDVLDPEQIGQRVTLVNRYPTYLLVQSRKVQAVSPFTRTPQQSDYVALWQEPGAVRHTPSTIIARTESRESSSVVRRIRVRLGTLVPEALKTGYRRLRHGRDPFDSRFFRLLDRR